MFNECTIVANIDSPNTLCLFYLFLDHDINKYFLKGKHEDYDGTFSSKGQFRKKYLVLIFVKLRVAVLGG